MPQRTSRGNLLELAQPPDATVERKFELQALSATLSRHSLQALSYCPSW